MTLINSVFSASNINPRLQRSAGAAFVIVLLAGTAPAHAESVILGCQNSAGNTAACSEDWQGVSGPFVGFDPTRQGIATSDGNSDGNSVTIGNSNIDFYGGRFEFFDNGDVWQDVGVQQFGGGSNNTKTGKVEDDAGILFRVDTTGYTDISLDFDWRTFSTSKNDKVIAGYYIGDLIGDIGSSEIAPGVPVFDAAMRTFDLRNVSHGGADGVWNWNPINGSGNEGDWNELLRANSPRFGDPWQNAWFGLPGAENGEIWIALWLDNGENDFGKIDNIEVKGTIIPVPAAAWLFGSALFGLFGLRRRP